MDTQTVKIEHDVLTNEIIERPFTSEELAQIEIDKLEEAALLAAQIEKQEAKATLLTKLGITEDEARLLLS
jgi:hypothetical protein